MSCSLKASEPLRFEVQYFEIAPPGGCHRASSRSCASASAIGEAELTFKLRGSEPLPARADAEEVGLSAGRHQGPQG